MPTSEQHGVNGPEGSRQFASTHWSVVLAAGHSSAPGAREALDKLCGTYWFPLYAYVRRRGHNPHDAQDLTQSFFAWLIESKHLRVADAERGRFRSFLLGMLKNFLSDDRKRAHAQKRGGGRALISLDAASAEERYDLEPATDLTPDLIFDRRWAWTVMEQTVTRLRDEYVAAGRAELFDALKQFQPGEDAGQSYAEVATRLGLTESAVKSAIWRLRQRHRDLLREEIAHTVATPADVDGEIRHLLCVLGGSFGTPVGRVGSVSGALASVPTGLPPLQRLPPLSKAKSKFRDGKPFSALRGAIGVGNREGRQSRRDELLARALRRATDRLGPNVHGGRWFIAHAGARAHVPSPQRQSASPTAPASRLAASGGPGGRGHFPPVHSYPGQVASADAKAGDPRARPRRRG